MPITLDSGTGERQDDPELIFSRRALIIGALQGVALTAVGGRLAWLQIAQGPRYRTLADENRINLRLIAPSRGLILDRQGRPLAANVQNFRAVIVPEQTKDLEASLSRLQKLIPVSQRDIQRVLRQVRQNARFVPIEIKDNLSWEEVAHIEVNLPDLPGISIDEGEIRNYPAGASTAHLIGYVGSVSQSDVSNDPLLKTPGFMIGKTGIEKAFDEKMRGTSGTAEIEVNVLGREVRELRRRPGRRGETQILSIDSELQQYTHDRLSQQRSASAVIMDVHSGAVYAMASVPSFDPNVFSKGIPAELWEELLADPGKPLNNKAAGGQYPPGSTFKMVTALAGLEHGLINRHNTAFCPGHYEFGNSRFHCWKKGGHGTVDLNRALAESCDVYFYKFAVELGIDRLADYARRLGLGAKLDVGLPEERAGLVPTRKWKAEKMNEPWQQGENIVASIGQGYLLTTPLQLAVMTARLVNGGKAVRPWLCASSANAAASRAGWPELEFSKKHMDMILRGMESVTMTERGTAFSSRIKEEGFEMGGKTGTAQVKRITKQERLQGIKNEDLAWHLRHHALFVGYAPVVNPRYSCAVVVEHGGGGSTAAAPVARDLLYAAQKRDPASKTMVKTEAETGQG